MTTQICWNVPAISPPKGSYRVFEVGHPDELARAFKMLDGLNDIWGAGTHWIESAGIPIQRKTESSVTDSKFKQDMLESLDEQKADRAAGRSVKTYCLAKFDDGQLRRIYDFIVSFPPHGDGYRYKMK